MKLEQLFNKYAFNDGKVLFFTIDFIKSSCVIKLEVRRHVLQQKCEIELHFTEVIDVVILEDFRTNGGYSDITFKKTSDESFYCSLDPYDNSGKPNDKDNFIIIAKLLVITDNKETHEMS